MNDLPRDRRQSPRHTALRREARLGWWDGPRFRSSRARLVNISPGGALIEVESVPPTRSPIWIASGEDSGAIWCEAVIVAKAPARALRGEQRLRLAFVSAESIAFFEAATRPEESSKAARNGPGPMTEVPVPALAPLVRLGLLWPSSTDEIRHAYRQLAKQLHPDHGGSTTAFLELRHDYEAALALCSGHVHDHDHDDDPASACSAQRNR